MKPTTFDRINDLNITSEMKTSFMSYAMSVIVSRALPDVRDGLKPVHRRILYGMEGLGVYPNASYKKSARIVGDVMGKYHPHGDSAIYDAMVRMAQEFSYRYPLVDGHGNFGSIDGDGAAAMRYTEAKMTKLSMEMLKDIKKNTIDFADNYDGTEKEPVVLPSKFPNLLVNGSTGIAVGMATNIPPHNLGETIDGIIATIDNPDIDLDGLMQFIKAPDFPTGGIIMGLTGVRKAYETGNGSFKIRSKCDITTKDNGKSVITVHEIPYQVNKTRLIEKIAELAKEKRIEGITDLRDESNRDGIKIIIELRKGVNPEVTLNNLYKFTPMQVSFGMNTLALVNQQPKVLSLKETIEHYIDHQLEVLVRRTAFDLEKARARAHILEGLLKALDNIDAIIEIIRNAYDDPQEQLMEAFEFTEEQAKAILEMRLRKLSGLEREKIDDELAGLRASIEEYETILGSEDKQREVIKEDLLALKDSHSNKRKSDISLAHDLELEDEDLIPEEDVIITITQEGYCKRMNATSYKIQNRGGKGMTGIKMHDDDAVEHLLYTSTHDYLLFFTNLGRVYKIKGYKIPEFSRASKGLPLVNILDFEADETLQAITHIKDFDSDDYLFFTTKKGIVKRTGVKDYQNIRSSGIRALTLRDQDELHDVKLTDGKKDIILGASNGKAIRFNESTVRPMGRTAAGVRGIQLKDSELVVGTTVVDDTIKEILVVTEKGYGKRTSLDEYRLQNRGGKGVKTLNVTEKNGNLVRLVGVSGEEDLIILSDRGTMIRIPVIQISCSSRATQGVRLIRLNEGHAVASTAIVPHDEDEETDHPEEELPDEATSEPTSSAAQPQDTDEPGPETTDEPSAPAGETSNDEDEPDDDEEATVPENLFDFGSSN
ncbi:MAG: DNA gyrase subunit A [Bacillota bacterium]